MDQEVPLLSIADGFPIPDGALVLIVIAFDVCDMIWGKVDLKTNCYQFGASLINVCIQ